MRQEIKERVERIRKGEVPEGYKETKVGIIPEDWEVTNLNKFVSGNGQYGVNAPSVEYSKKLPTYIRITDIDNNGRLIKNKLTSVDINDFEEYELMTDDLLFVRTGSTTGKTYLHIKENGKLVFAGFLIRFVIKKSIASPKFVKLFTESNKYWHWVKIMSARSGQPGINAQEYEKLPLPDISQSEQQKIAEILSTWDKAIELKEKLIEEKNEFKRGLMQKLLAGKIRFPEFTGDWAEIPLKNIVKRITTKNKENNKTVITISAKKGFVNQDEYFNKLVASKDLSGYFLIKKGDFAYNKSYSNGYPVGAIKRLDSFENAVVTTLYICFRMKDGEVSSNFLKYYFDSGLLNRQIKRIANEGGRAHGLLNVTPSDFFNIKVNLPKYEEQEKISATLLTNEQGIQLLEQDIFELKEQKRGLMQLLLTGILRVEVD